MDKSLSVPELVLVDMLHVEMENVQVEAFDTFFFTFFSSFEIFLTAPLFSQLTVHTFPA